MHAADVSGARTGQSCDSLSRGSPTQQLGSPDGTELDTWRAAPLFDHVIIYLRWLRHAQLFLSCLNTLFLAVSLTESTQYQTMGPSPAPRRKRALCKLTMCHSAASSAHAYDAVACDGRSQVRCNDWAYIPFKPVAYESENAHLDRVIYH